MKVWRYFLPAGDSSEEALVVSLEQAGVTSEPLRSSTPEGPGIVFFGETTKHLFDFLRQTSHRGLERILAIATHQDAFAPDNAWQLLHAGASDVLCWDSTGQTPRKVKERLARWAEIDRLISSPTIQDSLVGQSPAWVSVLRQIVEVARYTDASILLTGESGTGKELVARVIHALSPRADRELVILDCTTVVPELSGSEFFGHERGAFTGAITSREGAFALANGGSLFLDEVSELPLTLQAELLRVVQEHTYKRVGSNTWQRTDFRLICASNRDLLEEQGCGHFRRDLYYRIAGWPCRLPPLRERPEDILPLAHHFLHRLRSNLEPLELDEPVRHYLLGRDYPGNVRDLRQLMTRILLRHVGPSPITVGDIPDEERPVTSGIDKGWCDENFERAVSRAVALGAGLKEIGRVAEDVAVRIAVHQANGNLQHAAETLRVSDRALQLRRAARRAPGRVTNSEPSSGMPFVRKVGSDGEA